MFTKNSLKKSEHTKDTANFPPVPPLAPLPPGCVAPDKWLALISLWRRCISIQAPLLVPSPLLQLLGYTFAYSPLPMTAYSTYFHGIPLPLNPWHLLLWPLIQVVPG